MEITEQTWAFIAEHRHEDVRELALHAKRGAEVDLPFALEQIAGWQRAQVKLPDWAACDGLIFPPQVPMEQCSSQFTAQYKARLAARLLAETMHVSPAPSSVLPSTSLVDLTGGFGVDFSYMARAFDQATYVERQSNLCEIARHNFPLLGLDSVQVINDDSTEVLNKLESVSMLFLDPARRDSHGSRTYAIADCTPDVLALQSQLLSKAPVVVVKLSPMLDWHKTVDDFAGSVHEVHVVSTGNECKDLLLVLKRGICDEPRIVCVNDEQTLEYRVGNSDVAMNPDESTRSVETGEIDIDSAQYLYEPNASIMKAGCFDVIARRFPVTMIAPNSHLFISEQRVDDFPGRSFAIKSVASMNKKELKSSFAGLTHANIAVRNFPMPVNTLRKKLKLKDGGSTYLFATTDRTGRHILISTVKA
ncbi:SAM-dependent methyltransferase [Bifidobacterium saguini]|uniref:SAM-dependent methyltransferase n=1 Tax=Bifidobacterium saguini TaxID=762210 RepID=A0ABX7SBG2_9BIFI|nr:DNA methyltransferase [Bifidobacterium saguini]QTB90682.1 SAM-dependent methyltransferase [Bifidobacterium saguini]